MSACSGLLPALSFPIPARRTETELLMQNITSQNLSAPEWEMLAGGAGETEWIWGLGKMEIKMV